MSLSNPIKVIVGVSTLLVMLIPLGFFLLWGLMVFPAFTGERSVDFPFQAENAIFSFAFPLICFLNILIYGLYAFYITHAIKNENGSDIIRIIALFGIFFLPYLGMPFYFVVYIFFPTPPSWALKKQPASL
jgi:hypothetical protein